MVSPDRTRVPTLMNGKMEEDELRHLPREVRKVMELCKNVWRGMEADDVCVCLRATMCCPEAPKAVVMSSLSCCSVCVHIARALLGSA